MPQINALPPQNAPAGDDVFPSDDTSDGNNTKKLSLTKLKEWLQSLTGWIATAMLADEAVSNAKLKTGTNEPGGAWTAYTPVWTNLTIGNAVVTAAYKKIGRTVHVRIRAVLGSSSSASANTVVYATLPVAAASGYTGASVPFGNCRISDTGNANYVGVMRSKNTTDFDIISYSANGTWATEYGLPSAMGNGDIIEGSFTYEAAA